MKLRFIKILTFLFFLFPYQQNLLSNENLLNNPSIKISDDIPSKGEIDIQNDIYILGPGDVLNIEVNDYTLDLNNVLPISGEGFIKLKGLKKIYVKGLTISELTNILNQEYLNNVKYPDVDITILKYRPIKIYIQGEVEETGLHVLPGSFNLKVSNNNQYSLPTRLNKSIFNINRPHKDLRKCK